MRNENEKPCQSPTPVTLKETYSPVNKTFTPVGARVPVRDVDANYQPVAPQGQPVGSARPTPPQGGSGVPSSSGKK